MICCPDESFLHLKITSTLILYEQHKVKPSAHYWQFASHRKNANIFVGIFPPIAARNNILRGHQHFERRCDPTWPVNSER